MLFLLVEVISPHISPQQQVVCSHDLKKDNTTSIIHLFFTEERKQNNKCIATGHKFFAFFG